MGFVLPPLPQPRAQTSGNNGVLSLVVTAYCAVTSDGPKNVPPSELLALPVCLQENNTMTSNWWELCCRFCSEMCGFSLGEYNKTAKPIQATPFDCPAWNIGGIWKVLRRSDTRQRRPATCTSWKGTGNVLSREELSSMFSLGCPGKQDAKRHTYSKGPNK